MAKTIHQEADSWFRLVHEQGVVRAAQAFGLELGRGSRGVPAIPCPACGQEKRHRKSRDKRAAANIFDDELRWHCFQCGETGDAVALAAALVTGRPKPDASEWARVRDACAERGLCPWPGSDKPWTPRVIWNQTPRVASAATPSEERPPAVEVAQFWRACGSVTENAAASAYLTHSRNMLAADVTRLDLARLAPLNDSFAWWPRDWSRRWPLVIPAYEAEGAMASVHGRAIDDSARPKTIWPKGFSSSALVFADRRGLSLLQGSSDAGGLEAACVVEGFTDVISASLWLERSRRNVAVLGVTSGGARAFSRIRWPRGLPCYIGTDDDADGDKYAADVRTALKREVRTIRVRITGGGR